MAMKIKDNVFNIQNYISIVLKQSYQGFKRSGVMVFFTTLLICEVSQAYKPKPGKVTAAAGPFFYASDSLSNNGDVYTRPRLGFALISEAVVAKNSAVEIGLFYFNKPYFRSEGSQFILQKIQRMYITTGYRWWWSKKLSSGVNLFSAFSMGDVETTQSSPGLDEDFKTSAEEITNYGLDVSVRFEHEFNPRDGIFIDLRYSYSLTVESGEKSNPVMLGLFYSRDIDAN